MTKNCIFIGFPRFVIIPRYNFTGNLGYDMTDLMKDRKHLQKYADTITTVNRNTTKTGIYGIPSEISEQSPQTSNDGIEPLVAPYVRWDAYRLAGYPKMNTLEDYISVMEKLQQQQPLSDSGKKHTLSPYSKTGMAIW